MMLSFESEENIFQLDIFKNNFKIVSYFYTVLLRKMSLKAEQHAQCKGLTLWPRTDERVKLDGDPSWLQTQHMRGFWSLDTGETSSGTQETGGRALEGLIKNWKLGILCTHVRIYVCVYMHVYVFCISMYHVSWILKRNIWITGNADGQATLSQQTELSVLR